MSEHRAQNWYVRSKGKVTGPFPAGLVGRYILLGRIKFDDEVSADREQWQPVKRVHHLIPDAIKDVARNPDDEEARERLKAARRWADERLESAAKGDSRGVEDDAEMHHRMIMASRTHERKRQNRVLQYLLAITLAVVVVGGVLLIPRGDEFAEPQCDAPAAPGVNWSNCLMQGSRLANSNLEGAVLRNTNLSRSVLRAARLVSSDLAYANLSASMLRGADLSKALMKGANLRSADLSRANLSGVDLSYADLSGADLKGTIMKGAKLDNAIWGPDFICLPGSVGECRLGKQSR